MKKKDFSTEEIPPIENNGKTYYSNQEKATIFNTFFAAQSEIEENDNEAMADVTWVDSFINNICHKIVHWRGKKCFKKS